MYTLQDFAEQIKRMRAAQRRYFKDRTPGALDEARQLEALIDKMCATLLETRTPTLFDNEQSCRLHEEAEDLYRTAGELVTELETVALLDDSCWRVAAAETAVRNCLDRINGKPPAPAV